MDTGTPGLWRRRSIAAVGTLGIAVAGGGLFFPGTAAATPPPLSQHWDVGDDGPWEVPDSICAIDWTVQGGAGGTGTGAEGGPAVLGGKGGLVEASTTVSPGQVFVLGIGARGEDGTADGATGGNSGSGVTMAAGGNSTGYTDALGAGGAGGGASTVWTGAEPVLVAGGGGGAGGGT